MAKHLYPDQEEKPLTSYINDRRLQPWAIESEKLLFRLARFKVWEVQYKGQGVANTCWYVGMVNKKEPFLLNFTIIPSNLNVEFRFSQYLPPDIFESLKWQNSSWRYADLNTYGADRIHTMIEKYLNNIQGDFDADLLEQGGKSFAEKIIYRSLCRVFKGTDIQTNIRLDELRSTLNKPLEFDIYIPSIPLAIEIQGPQHFKAVYGRNDRLKENDQYKKNWCRSNDIKFVWMNWEGINRDLLKLSYEKRTQQLGTLLSNFIKSERLFLWWKNIDEQHVE
ncbi:MAG: hypothetical protein V2A69_05750 [Pseudomonadota bacterium]